MTMKFITVMTPIPHIVTTMKKILYTIRKVTSGKEESCWKKHIMIIPGTIKKEL